MADSKNFVSIFLKRKFNNVRERLNTERFHFMPLNLKAFEVALAGSLDDPAEVATIFNGVVAHISSRHTNYIPVSQIPKLKKDALKGKPSIVYQNSKENIVGILYQGYNSAYESAFRSYLNSSITKLVSGPFGQMKVEESPIDLLSDTKYSKSKYQKGYDVGHMYGGAKSSFADTPLSYKLRILLEAVNNLSNNKLVLASRVGIPTSINKQEQLANLSNTINTALLDLEKQSNLGIQVNATLSKSVTDNLAKVNAVIILPQGRYENQKEYGVDIEGVIEKGISDLLKTIKFSPSLLDEISNRAVSPLIGTKPKNITAKLHVPNILVKNPVKTKVATTTSKKTIDVVKVPTYKITTNLSSLQMLINTHLQDVISANMGNGNDKRILNYRTGRFAASAAVERMSESRDGMITAFYTYMQNPYATFSEGGRQQYPKTRDPKLLIGKSIKEIAATQVGNRLRAVLV